MALVELNYVLIQSSRWQCVSPVSCNKIPGNSKGRRRKTVCGRFVHVWVRFFINFRKNWSIGTCLSGTICRFVFKPLTLTLTLVVWGFFSCLFTNNLNILCLTHSFQSNVIQLSPRNTKIEILFNSVEVISHLPNVLKGLIFSLSQFTDNLLIRCRLECPSKFFMKQRDT